MKKRLFLSLFSIIVLTFSTPSHARDSFLDIEEIKTESGITAWLVQDDSVPVIAFDFSFKNAGSAQEPDNKQGLAQILSNTMDEGAGEIQSEAFQKELRDKSISLSFSSSRDNFGGGVKTLTTNKDRAFELLKLAINEPRFDEAPLARMIASNKARIRSSLSDPDWIAARIMNDVAYQGHPYARNSGGTLSSLDNITSADLKAFKEKHLTKDRLHIAVAGDISKDELTKIIENVFGALPDTATESKVEDLKLQNKNSVFLHDKDIPQTVIQIMHPGVARSDPDFHTAQVMNFILGSSGFGSRMTEEIREKRGLTYGIYTFMSNMDHFSGLGISTSTQNESVKEMMGLIEAEWNKMRSYPVTDEELDNAKSYLIGSLPLSLTSTDKISGLLLSLQLDGLGSDYLDKREDAIKNTTKDDIFRLAQKLLNPEHFVTVMVGKPEKITPTKTIEALPNVE